MCPHSQAAALVGAVPAGTIGGDIVLGVPSDPHGQTQYTSTCQRSSWCFRWALGTPPGRCAAGWEFGADLSLGPAVLFALASIITQSFTTPK